MLMLSPLGSPKYGVVPQMPLTTIAAPVNLLDNTTYSATRVGNDTARVGYYKTTFTNGVSVELSASRHAGIMQYSYPPTAEKYILVDLSHVSVASLSRGSRRLTRR